MEKLYIIDCNPVFGFVNYGSIEFDINNSYDFGIASKQRCKTCGAAWLAENYVEGRNECPKCGETKPNQILAIK